MKSTARIVTIFVVSILIIFHFTLLAINSLFPNRFSFYYTYPFFQQNWNLFVPTPRENYDLYCIYTKNNIETKRNLLKDILTKHKSNHFFGNELLLTGLLSSVHYYKNDPSSKNLKVLEHFTKQVLEYSENAPITSLKFIVVVSPVDSGKTEVYHTLD